MAGAPSPADLAQARSGLAWVVTQGITLRTTVNPQDQGYPAAVAQQAVQAALGFAEPLALPAAAPALTGAVGPDYTLLVAAPDAGSAGTGYYGVQTRDGRRRSSVATLTTLSHPEEATYRTLIAALTELLERIRAARRDPAQFQIQVVLASEPVLLRLAQRSGSVAREPPGAASVRRLLARFGQVDLIGQPHAWVAAWFTAGDLPTRPPRV